MVYTEDLKSSARKGLRVRVSPRAQNNSMATILGIIGVIVIAIAVWAKKEKRQDALFVIGGLCLLIYSISINNLIFSILQVVFVGSTLIAFFKLKKS